MESVIITTTKAFAAAMLAATFVVSTASAQTGGAVGVGVGINEGVVVSGTVGRSTDDAAAKASRAAHGGVSAAVGGSVSSGHTPSARANGVRVVPEPAAAPVVPVNCVSITVTRPAEDVPGLLEKNMARTVFFGEGITPDSIKACNAKARVSEAEGHVATFAGYKPGVGATYMLPRTGKTTLVYFSQCQGGKRVYRSATVVLDGNKGIVLTPKEASNKGCTAA